MFKMGLLTSTAMTAVALLLSGANAAQAQTAMHVASRDPNTRFLCTFGNLRVYSYFGASQSSSKSGWQHVAVRVTGHGQTVSHIKIKEAHEAGTSGSAFTAGIYSNTASGLPGNVIAVGTGKTGPSCGRVTVSIRPTTLKSNKKYWIEERTSTTHSSLAAVYWEVDPNTKRRAYVQYYRESCSSFDQCFSSTSPWMTQTSGPWFKLK